jgi:hypothetical protein
MISGLVYGFVAVPIIYPTGFNHSPVSYLTLPLLHVSATSSHFLLLPPSGDPGVVLYRSMHASDPGQGTS